MPPISPNDRLITPTTKYSFTPHVITVLLVNLIIGSAPDKLGQMFDCGIILAPILAIVIATLTIFSMFLITKALAFYHLSTPDEIVYRQFGWVISIIFGMFTVIFYLLINVQYYHYISGFLGKIILYYQPKASVFVLDPFFLNSILFIFYIVPIIHTVSLKMMLIFAIIAIIAICVMVVNNIFCLAVEKTLRDEKKIPTSSITYFIFNHSTVFCFTQMTSFFQLYPFNYPGIRHLKHNSVKTWTIVVSKSILFSLLFFIITGEFKYFINYYSMSIPNKNNAIADVINSFAQIVLTAASFPATMNPARYTIQNCFLRIRNNNFIMWYFFGYCFQAAAYVISSIYYKIGDYVNFVITLLSSILSLILPAALYLCTFKFSAPKYAIVAAFLIMVGIASMIFNILDVFDFI